MSVISPWAPLIDDVTNFKLGLTRVRRFQQDDAHIFARTDQVSPLFVVHVCLFSLSDPRRGVRCLSYAAARIRHFRIQV